MSLTRDLLDDLASRGVPVSLGKRPVWAVESSDPNAFYFVVQVGEHYVCTCTGARYGHRCRHVKMAEGAS